MKLCKAIVLGSLLCTGATLLQAAPSEVHPIAQALSNNYNLVVENCGLPSQPAFQCSGVIIRVTKASPYYHAWDPSPNSVAHGGVSFSYIRRDIPTTNLAVGSASGIIYYPTLKQPADKGNAEVLCAYPTDGYTVDRNFKDGCGAHKSFKFTSGTCQKAGIKTADKWYKHFASFLIWGENRYKHQCGFDVSSSESNNAAIFNESIKSQQKLLNKGGYLQWNELMIKTWETNGVGQITTPEKLPIQAFFYRADNNVNGLNEAQFYQKDYLDTTGILIPIVRVDLPKSQDDTARFYYDEEDQIAQE